jgi:aquaporin Z
MFMALHAHWPEYLMEAAELGMFMISACVFATIVGHPASPLAEALPHPTIRRLLMGIAMGLTAVGIIYSPWGQQSGGHLNPAVTLTFLRLGKVRTWDALFYIGAQFLGGIAGVLVATMFLREAIAHPAVNYVTTRPGEAGLLVAFVAEFGISFILMSVVLRISNTGQLARYTPLFAGVLVAIYITLEAPLSGMSMNPARTVRQRPPNSGHRYGSISHRPRWGCSQRRRSTDGRRAPMLCCAPSCIITMTSVVSSAAATRRPRHVRRNTLA